MKADQTSHTTMITLGLLGVLLLGVAGAIVMSQRNAGDTSAASVAGLGGNVSASPGCTTSTQTYGNITYKSNPCTSYGFKSAVMKNSTLTSWQVLGLIKKAYDYHIVYFGTSLYDKDVSYAVLNVTGSQVVSGNYAGGYNVSYTGNLLVNVTIIQVLHSSYDVTGVTKYALPDRNTTITYGAPQVLAIRAALADPSVQSMMTGPHYYVEYVGTPGTTAMNGTYFVQFYQVDGTGTVGAFVTSDYTSVVNSYSEQRVTGECWPNGIVITDPWGATGYTGCASSKK